MNSLDVVVICAEALPAKQGLDLVLWYCRGEVSEGHGHALFQHLSLQWYIMRHAGEISQAAHEDKWGCKR